jgi:hypothetical protein
LYTYAVVLNLKDGKDPLDIRHKKPAAQMQTLLSMELVLGSEIG